jgi:ABC-type transport system involved in cytochrome bd biosynthesis fused ATPase/permease subunit
LWPVLRLRNRRLKTLEREGAAGREGAHKAREDFTHALEALPGAGFTEALTRLDRTLEEAHAPTWRWRRAQARYPALLETALFFVLCVILFAGAATLQGFESVLLFAMLLLLAYRPLREAARQYPVAAAGDRAARDLNALIGAWNPLPERTLPAPHTDPHSLGLDGVTFAYEPGQTILNDATITLDARRVTGLSGPNGAGKTTLLRLLCGAETPQAGRVSWPAAARQGDVPRGIAVMPQRAWPGHDWPAWAAAYKAVRPDGWKTLDDLLGLERLTARAAHPETLSGGERQRMTLARTLASDAAYLVLDEPTTALPADEREHVLRGALAFWKNRASRTGEARETRGALVVSHEPFLQNLCDTLVRLEGKPS